MDEFEEFLTIHVCFYISGILIVFFYPTWSLGSKQISKNAENVKKGSEKPKERKIVSSNSLLPKSSHPKGTQVILCYNLLGN